MKTFLEKLLRQIESISTGEWRIIRMINESALAAILILAMITMPEWRGDEVILPFLVIGVIQLLTALMVALRANELEKRMLSIDAENDVRDNHSACQIELLIQDVHWLIKREIERTGVQSLDDDIRLREIVGAQEFSEGDHDAHVRDFLNLGKGEAK